MIKALLLIFTQLCFRESYHLKDARALVEQASATKVCHAVGYRCSEHILIVGPHNNPNRKLFRSDEGKRPLLQCYVNHNMVPAIRAKNRTFNRWSYTRGEGLLPGSIHKRKINSVVDFVGRGLTHVVNFCGYSEIVKISPDFGNLDRDFLAMNISSNLGLTNVSGVFGHLLSFPQCGPNQINRPKPDKQPDKPGPPHDASESSHLLLGIKIALGALMVLCGFYYLTNAASYRRGVEVGRAFALYPLCGILGVAAGGFLIAHTLLG